MSQKAIREFDGKRLLAEHIGRCSEGLSEKFEVCGRVHAVSDISRLDGPEWLRSERLVVKPDQLIKRPKSSYEVDETTSTQRPSSGRARMYARHASVVGVAPHVPYELASSRRDIATGRLG